jgi:hypothetical protein
MGKEIENHQFLCCVTPLAVSITGIPPTSAPLHVDPIPVMTTSSGVTLHETHSFFQVLYG